MKEVTDLDELIQNPPAEKYMFMPLQFWVDMEKSGVDIRSFPYICIVTQTNVPYLTFG